MIANEQSINATGNKQTLTSVQLTATVMVCNLMMRTFIRRGILVAISLTPIWSAPIYDEWLLRYVQDNTDGEI